MTNEANIFYKIMSLGLKNVWATYHRLMDRVFRGLIGRSIEVYVDDTVVKSETCKKHVEELQKVFNVLKRYNMR